MGPSNESLTWAAKLVELLLVFGGVIAFAWWQLRDVDRARQQTQARRAAERSADPETPAAVASGSQPAGSTDAGEPR